jgi:hypothetical protein
MTGIALSFLKGNLVMLPLALFLIAKGGVAIVSIAATVAALRRRYDLLALALLAWLPSVFASLLLHDLSRSLAYSFPIFFVALAFSNCTLKTVQCRRVLLGAVLFNLALPTYYIMNEQIFALLPILRML